ncbi:uncharacterized protein LOC127737139 [Mytilus californianus]|uniref:uncharacterized protein LOC127737139 n=1 Tax=Mytilus californianus TaxID=6549 RepID=UPI0022464DF8|nr:uncharacterized protein LOC127737139 [Mytilus californianus]
MKLQVVAALLCLIVFLHSEGKPQGKGKCKGKAKNNYELRYKKNGYHDQENPCKRCKAPCKTLPTTCPEGYTKLTNQSISPNCYLFGGSNVTYRTDWHVANAICTSTPGAYLWIPETREEAEAVLVKFDVFGILGNFDVFTGANNLADRYSYVYSVTNDPFDQDNLPYGIPLEGNPHFNNKSCFELEWDVEKRVFEWDADDCSGSSNEAYICEFPIVNF